MACNCSKTNEIKLNVQKTYPDAILPEYGHKGDACIDLAVTRIIKKDGDKFEIIDFETIIIEPDETIMFDTGLVFEIPDGYEMKMYPRSSLGIKKDVRLANTVAIIDSAYRGEIRVVLRNSSKKPVIINYGERVVQIQLKPVPRVIINEVPYISANTERGINGIGSTGLI